MRKLIERGYECAKEILNRRRADLNLIVSELIKKETLERDELENLLRSSQPEYAART